MNHYVIQFYKINNVNVLSIIWQYGPEDKIWRLSFFLESSSVTTEHCLHESQIGINYELITFIPFIILAASVR
jgi:hypothetical protein